MFGTNGLPALNTEETLNSMLRKPEVKRGTEGKNKVEDRKKN